MKKIASVHYDAVELDRSKYGGFYRIPAVPLNSPPEILVITDKTEKWQTSVSEGRRERRETIFAREIALDCILHWTQSQLGCSPACHPGIWMVRDEIPLLDDKGLPQMDADRKQIFREATKEEYERMFAEDEATNRAADAEYADLMIAQANEWHNSPNPKDRRFISPHHKLAARNRGKDADWLKSGAQLDVKACVFCTKMVPINAIKCPHCNEVIDPKKYYAAKNELKEAAEEAAPKEKICSDCKMAFRDVKELTKHRIDRVECERAQAQLKSA